MTDYDYIIAVDPGGTTGWARYGVQHGSWEAGEIRGRANYMRHFKDGLAANGDRRILVVMEAFVITARTLKVSREYDSLYLIGACEDRCSDYPLVDFAALQTANDAKNFCSDDRLRKAGWWSRGGGGHANDASRHLFLQLAKLRLINPVEIDRRALS